jgi:hypothetical protein
MKPTGLFYCFMQTDAKVTHSFYSYGTRRPLSEMMGTRIALCHLTQNGRIGDAKSNTKSPDFRHQCVNLELGRLFSRA